MAGARVSKEQIEKARTVNLPNFLISNGFNLKKIGSEYTWLEHDSIRIKNNAPGELGKWFRFSTQQGGGNIDFLKEFMNCTFVEAVEALTGEKAIVNSIDNKQSQMNLPEQINNQKEFAIAENNDSKRAIAYLTKTREIDYNLIIGLVKKGAISQEEKTGNVLFKYFDNKGKVIGAEKVGTSTEPKLKYKGIATGSESGYGFEIKRGNGEKAYFFESAIDMLSFVEMYNKELDNCRMISMMGVKPNIVLETMKRNNIKSENVYLCSDNDEAGNNFANKLIAQYPDMKRVVTDNFKDWNDLLRGNKAKEREKGEHLVNVTDEIIKKKKHFTSLVNSNELTQANDLFQNLSDLNNKADLIKEEIQAEKITTNDVEVLRSIEPKRKSVQNMLETEVSKTPKFEKLLKEQFGEKSAFEMRKGNNNWLKDESKTVPIINVQKRDIPEKLSDIRKKNDIPRGTFVNKDTGIEIQFGRKSINEIIAKALPDVQRNIPVEARMATLYQMQELIENAVFFDSQISDYDTVTSKNKSPNSLFIHRMHGVIDYEGKKYLANLSIEENYITDKENNFNGTSNRLYSFRDIRITPVELLGDQAYAGLLTANEDTPSGVTTISIPHLYEIVKTLDARFFENKKALGRAEREQEIAEQGEYLNAVKKLEEYNNEKRRIVMPVQDLNSTIEKTNDTNKATEQNSVNQQKLTEEEILKQAELIKERRKLENQNLPQENEEPKKEETKFHDPVIYSKLCPFLNAKANYLSSKLNNLKDKRITHEVKIQKNINKIEKLKSKAEKLEDMNKMLLAINPDSPSIQALVKRNQEKIKNIRQNKIPARQSIIKHHKSMIEMIDKKSERIGHKLERCVALSNAVQSFGIIGRHRRNAFTQAITELNKASYNCVKDKYLDKVAQLELNPNNAKLIAQVERLKLKMEKLDKFSVRYDELSDKQIDKAMENTQQSINDNLTQGFKNLSELSENIIEKNNSDPELHDIENLKKIQKLNPELNAEISKMISFLQNKSKADISKIEKIADNKTANKVVKDDKTLLNKTDERSAAENKNSEQNVSKSEGQKINPEYFEKLPKDKRFVRAGLTIFQAKILLKELANQNIKYSAVLDKNNSKVTINKDDTHLMNDKSKKMFDIDSDRTSNRRSFSNMLDDTQKQVEKQNLNSPNRDVKHKEAVLE